MINQSIKQAWFADDVSAAGDLLALRQWWKNLVQIEPDYIVIVQKPD